MEKINISVVYLYYYLVDIVDVKILRVNFFSKNDTVPD